jgi:lipoprotein signal peptidase
MVDRFNFASLADLPSNLYIALSAAFNIADNPIALSYIVQFVHFVLDDNLASIDDYVLAKLISATIDAGKA